MLERSNCVFASPRLLHFVVDTTFIKGILVCQFIQICDSHSIDSLNRRRHGSNQDFPRHVMFAL